MELKLPLHHLKCGIAHGSNRTFMELKYSKLGRERQRIKF